MKPQSPQQIRAELEAFLPKLHKRAEKASDLKAYVDDWCRIGSFLTNEKSVHTELERLNKELVSELISRLGPPPKPGQEHNRPKISLLKVLESVLDREESQENFNKGKQEWSHQLSLHTLRSGEEQKTEPSGTSLDLPSGAPTLSEFVDPAAFRKILFQHGYHWIDPGAGPEHGAYTHRIHWYCVTKAAKQIPLCKSCLDLFQGLACELCVTADGKQTLWDLLFDCFVTKSRGQRTPISDTYRSPEKLHGFLRSDATGKDHRYWLLSTIIRFSHDRDRGDWIDKLFKKGNIKLAVGVTADDRKVSNASGLVVWPKDRDFASELNKAVN